MSNASAIANSTTTVARTLSPAQISGLEIQKFVANQYHILQIVYSVSYASMFLLCVALVVYLRRNRSCAYNGDSDAARKVILPSFESLLWVLCITTGMYTFFFLGAAIFSYTKPITWHWFSELLLQGRQFILFLVIFFLLQRSVTTRSLCQSIAISFSLAFIPVLIVFVMDESEQSETTTIIVQIVYRSITCCGFIWLYFRPIARASVRTQRELYLFAIIYYVIVFIYIGFFANNDYSDGFMLVFCAVIWASFAPFFVWRVLKADTEHWRGVGDRAFELQKLLWENTQSMEEIVSAQGLRVLLEVSHRDIIDFAHLELRRKIGVGSSADVYYGCLETTKEVAVKVYSPREISETTILEFTHEAALCRALKHPNVVNFYGLCVSPPMICLVSELCRGSLDDALQQDKFGQTEPMWPKLCLMLDAARAVAYLHSFSPPFIHRDIKPANFLIGRSNVLKLTDFGESRSMASKGSDKTEAFMTMRGTVDYMAPEILDGRQGLATYTETADIYSLAITMWDILHPKQEKYPSSQCNHLNIYKIVLDGNRPPIDPEIHITLHDLLENAWNANAAFRPSAKLVVTILEDLQDELCGEIANRLSSTMSNTTMQSSMVSSRGLKETFPGQKLVECLLDHGYAMDLDEAVRLGNSLMDSGCLHHSTHTLPLENSMSTYYFDEYQLNINVPVDEHHVAIPGAGGVFDSTSIQREARALCGCRKLGQGHFQPKVPKKKGFRRRGNDPQVLSVNLLSEANSEVSFVEFSNPSRVLPITTTDAGKFYSSLS